LRSATWKAEVEAPHPLEELGVVGVREPIATLDIVHARLRQLPGGG